MATGETVGSALAAMTFSVALFAQLRRKGLLDEEDARLIVEQALLGLEPFQVVLPGLEEDFELARHIISKLG